MKHKNRIPLRLEILEDRWVPATVRYINGDLLVSNPIITAGTTNLTVTQKASNTFQVVDGHSSLGTYSGVSDLIITGSNAPDHITVNVSTFTYSGSMTIIGENGNDTVAITGGAGSGTGSGAILGNVTLIHTYGNESVGLNTLAAGGLTIGSANVVTQSGNDTISMGSTSTTVAGAAATNFLGDVNITGFNTVLMDTGGQPDSFGGNVNVSEGVNAGTPLFFTQGSSAGYVPSGFDTVTVGGNLTITGGSGNLPAGPGAIMGEGFPAGTTFGNQIVLGALTVGNNLNVTVGSTSSDPTKSAGNNFFTSAYSGITTVNGNQYYTSGPGVGATDISGEVIYGNAYFNLGIGVNYLGLEKGSTPTGASAPTIIGGNLSVNQSGGTLYTESVLPPVNQSPPFMNGNPVLAPNPATPVQAQIGGNVLFSVQNSNLLLPIDSSAAYIGGVLGVNAGNGNNTFTFAASGTSLAPTYNLNFHLGNGVNTVTNTDPLTELTGFVIAGNNPGNTFSNAGSIQSPWELAGF